MPELVTETDLERGLGWALLATGRRARALRALLLAAGDAGRVVALSAAEAMAISGEPEEVVVPLLTPHRAPGLAGQRERLRAAGARVVTILDPEYPRLLRETTDPPAVLFARGLPLDLAERPAIAVVGARRASRAGREAARRLAGELAAAGVAVVSGFARGIDAEAHRGALEGGGRTVAVFGCGADVCYPPEQEDLLDDLLEHGTVLSEVPLGTRPAPFLFPVRNRVIAGLSRIVLVVEAALKSGSLITARCAVDYGRDVAAVPGSIMSALAEGSNALLKDGAILVRHAGDLLAELPAEDRQRLGVATRGAKASPAGALPEGLDPDALAVLAALDADEPRDADALVERTRFPAARLSSALVNLELEGLVSALPGGVFLRRREKI